MPRPIPTNSTWRTGTGGHIAGELFKMMAGVDINLQTAKALGLEVPLPAQQLADEVIE